MTSAGSIPLLIASLFEERATVLPGAELAGRSLERGLALVSAEENDLRMGTEFHWVELG